MASIGPDAQNDRPQTIENIVSYVTVPPRMALFCPKRQIPRRARREQRRAGEKKNVGQPADEKANKSLVVECFKQKASAYLPLAP